MEERQSKKPDNLLKECLLGMNLPLSSERLRNQASHVGSSTPNPRRTKFRSVLGDTRTEVSGCRSGN